MALIGLITIAVALLVPGVPGIRWKLPVPAAGSAAVTWPQISDSHGHHAIGRGHAGKPAGRLAETAAAACGEEAEQTPALLGAG
jgi:hypothetical protein